MKKLVLFLCLTFSTVAFAQDPTTTLIKKLPESIFTPMGFDVNDNTQIVFDGVLSSSCYKAGPITTKVDRKAKRVYIRNQVYFTNGIACLRIVSNYTQIANLGALPSGAYGIYFEDEKGAYVQMGQIPVKAAVTAESDDFLYAPVQAMNIEDGATPAEKLVTIKGTFTNDCMQMSEVKILKRTANVVEILPLATMANNAKCADTNIPFRKTFVVSGKYSGHVLYHVRSLNGQALNQIVDYWE